MEAVVLEESLSPYALRPRTFRELSLITAAKAERANKERIANPKQEEARLKRSRAAKVERANKKRIANTKREVALVEQ